MKMKDVLIKSDEGDRAAKRTLRRLSGVQSKKIEPTTFFVGFYDSFLRTYFYGKTNAVSELKARNNFADRIKPLIRQYYSNQRQVCPHSQRDIMDNMKVFTSPSAANDMLGKFSNKQLVGDRLHQGR